MFSSQDAEKVERELQEIERFAGRCPDPEGGGCIGTHCTLCAVSELRAVLKRYMGKEETPSAPHLTGERT